MNPIKLIDGTELIPLSLEEKANLEKEMGELLTKHNAVIVPTLIKDISSLSASISIYKKASNETKTNESETNTETEEGSESNSA